MLRQGVRPRVAVEDAAHTGFACFRDGVPRVVLRLAGVNHHRPSLFGGEGDLRGKSRQLRATRRIIVVIVEPAFPDRDRAVPQIAPQCRYVSGRIECSGVVRVHSRRAEHETTVVRGEAGGDPSGLD